MNETADVPETEADLLDATPGAVAMDVAPAEAADVAAVPTVTDDTVEVPDRVTFLTCAEADVEPLTNDDPATLAEVETAAEMAPSTDVDPAEDALPADAAADTTDSAVAPADDAVELTAAATEAVDAVAPSNTMPGRTSGRPSSPTSRLPDESVR